jgi:hypothetical protein
MRYPWMKGDFEASGVGGNVLTDYAMFQMWKKWAGDYDPYVKEMIDRSQKPGDIVTIFGLCEHVARECHEQKT